MRIKSIDLTSTDNTSHHETMRTTISLEDDAMQILRTHAEKCGISLGAAASDLIRNGSRYQLTTRRVNGLPVFDVPSDFPLITDELVRQIADDE